MSEAILNYLREKKKALAIETQRQMDAIEIWAWSAPSTPDERLKDMGIGYWLTTDAKKQ